MLVKDDTVMAEFTAKSEFEDSNTAAEQRLTASYQVRAGNLAALLDGALGDARRSARQLLHDDDNDDDACHSNSMAASDTGARVMGAGLGAPSRGGGTVTGADGTDVVDGVGGHRIVSSNGDSIEPACDDRVARPIAGSPSVGPVAGGIGHNRQRDHYTDTTTFDSDADSDGDRDVDHRPDPLYADNLDEEDSKWVEQHMRRGGGRSGFVMQQSAAVLSCPACFTIVCLDCQDARGRDRRGESNGAEPKAGNRWLATDACDCIVESSTLGTCAHAVRCGYCNTVVGDYDDETQSYVFHTVIPTL